MVTVPGRNRTAAVTVPNSDPYRWTAPLAPGSRLPGSTVNIVEFGIAVKIMLLDLLHNADDFLLEPDNLILLSF